MPLIQVIIETASRDVKRFLTEMNYVCKELDISEEAEPFRNPEMVLIREILDDLICIPQGHHVYSTDALEILGPWLD